MSLLVLLVSVYNILNRYDILFKFYEASFIIKLIADLRNNHNHNTRQFIDNKINFHKLDYGNYVFPIVSSQFVRQLCAISFRRHFE